jgi:hypothetical protein
MPSRYYMRYNESSTEELRDRATDLVSLVKRRLWSSFAYTKVDQLPQIEDTGPERHIRMEARTY